MFDWWGSDKDENGKPKKEKDEIDKLLEQYEGAYLYDDIKPRGRVESREYKEYKVAEREQRKLSWYERLVDRLSFIRFEFDELHEEHVNALRLLGWRIDPDQIAPAALFIGLLAALVTVAILLLPMPSLFQFFFISIPFAVLAYMLKYPTLKAQQKVVKGSEDLIMAVLYMVIYMRSSPNLEGAVTFAAQHLQGPVAQDLKYLLWQIDIREYNDVQEALEDYVVRWQPYNEGFAESIQLVIAATSEANTERRHNVLTEAINRLMDTTREKMDEFAVQLKTPIMVLHGIGILLPVLGIILFPLISTFMGGGNMLLYLAFLYNVLIPVIVFIIMQNTLVSRPISFSAKSVNMEDIRPGAMNVELLGKTVSIPMFAVSIPLFILMIAWPGYFVFQILQGNASFPMDPGVTEMFRESLLVLAFGIPAGIHLIYGYKALVKRQGRVREIEVEFPEAMFELAHTLHRGKPIENAVDELWRKQRNMKISLLFRLIAQNIHERGMTFREAVFDPDRGAIHRFPSKLMSTIMEIVTESVVKGTSVTAQSIESISKYLRNIHETQKRLEELLEDTLSSVKFLAYILAPIVSGIAVGMGSVISQALFQIRQTMEAVNQTGGGAGGSATADAPAMMQVFSFDSIIAPGLLQLIVGIYLIELSILIGTLYIRLDEGSNPYRRNVLIGKLLIISLVLYTITVALIVGMFGGMISSSLAGA